VWEETVKYGAVNVMIGGEPESIQIRFVHRGGLMFKYISVNDLYATEFDLTESLL